MCIGICLNRTVLLITEQNRTKKKRSKRRYNENVDIATDGNNVDNDLVKLCSCQLIII